MNVRVFLLGLIGWLHLGTVQVRAEQFTLIDHTQELTSRDFVDGGQALIFKRGKFRKDAVTNWYEPVDYCTAGYFHVRMEISGMEEDLTPVQIGSFRFHFDTSPPAVYYQFKLKIEGNGVYASSCRIPKYTNRFGEVASDAFAKLPKLIWFKDYSSERSGVGSLKKRAPFKMRMVLIVSTTREYRPAGTYGGLNDGEIRHLKSAAAFWRQGQLGFAYRVARLRLSAQDPEKVAEARRVIAAADRHARENLAEIARMSVRDPVAAIEQGIKLAQQFQASKRAGEIVGMIRQWEKDPRVKKERAALRIYQAFRDAVKRLRQRLRGKKASDPGMAARNAGLIAGVMQYVGALYSRFPETRAFWRAVKVTRELGIPLPEKIMTAASQETTGVAFAVSALGSAALGSATLGPRALGPRALGPRPLGPRPLQSTPTAAGASPTARARPDVRKAGPVKPAGPDKAIIRQWDAKLKGRVAEALESGRKPRLTAQGRPLTVVKIDPDATLTVRMSGVEMKMAWSRLTLRNKKDVAVSTCRDDSAPDHALAAFYLLAMTNRKAAEEHLRQAGALADSLRAIFP